VVNLFQTTGGMAALRLAIASSFASLTAARKLSGPKFYQEADFKKLRRHGRKLRRRTY
jgi:hypothetical protein